jgi:hypothetical protein
VALCTRCFRTPAQRELAGVAGPMKGLHGARVHLIAPEGLCRDLDGEADVAIRSCRAPGTVPNVRVIDSVTGTAHGCHAGASVTLPPVTPLDRCFAAARDRTTGGHHEARQRSECPSINSVNILCEFFARFCLI